MGKKRETSEATKASPAFFFDRIADDPRPQGVFGHPMLPRIAAHDGRIAVAIAAAEGIELHRYENGSWRRETIVGKPVAQVHLAFGPDGELLVLHDLNGVRSSQHTYNEDGVDLALTRSEKGSWRTEVIAKELWQYCYELGRCCGLAIGPDGQPHVAWLHGEVAFYAHAHNGWKAENVGPASGGRVEIALAVDEQSAPHLVFANDFLLRHVVRSPGGEWETERIGDKYQTEHPSIVVRGAHVVAAYAGSAGSNERLFVARRENGAWLPEMVDRKDSNGFEACLGLDSAGNPHVGYQGRKGKAIKPAELRYAVRRGGKWSVQALSECGWVSSMTMDGDGPVFAYATEMKKGLSVANTRAGTRSAEENAKPMAVSEHERAREQWLAERARRSDKVKRGEPLYLESALSDRKFWEITLSGASHTIRFGKLGTKGQSQTKTFSTEAKALQDAVARMEDKHGLYLEPSEASEVRAAAEAARSKAEAAPDPEAREDSPRPKTERDPLAPLVWDLKDDADGPLLGRLRGVESRHELRDYDEPIYAKPNNAHFVMRRSTTDWPDVLTNAEHLLVVSEGLRDTLSAVDPKLAFWPVAIRDPLGQTVARPYFIALVMKRARCISSTSEWSPDAYHYLALENPSYEKVKAPAPVFRAQNTYLIVATPDAARAIDAKKHRGVRFVALEDCAGPNWTRVEAAYHVFTCGGVRMGIKPEGDYTDAIAAGQSVRDTFPKDAIAAMQPPKNIKKVSDFMSADGCMVVSRRIRDFFEAEGVGDVEYFPVKIKDHGGKVLPAEHYVMNLRRTQDYVDVEESSVRWLHDSIWTLYDLVVDETLLDEKPPFFRLARARYPWLFMRNDLVEKLTKMKADGWRARPVGDLRYTADDVDALIL